MSWEPDPIDGGGYEISEEDIVDGDNLAYGNYPLGRFILVDKEYVPKNAAERRWKDDVDQKIEAVINNISVTPGGNTGGETPGSPPPQGNTFLDTGWFKLTAGGDKVIVHNFGQIPTRHTLLCSSTQNPGIDDNIFYYPSIIHRVVEATTPSVTLAWTGMSLQSKRADGTYVDPTTHLVLVAGGDYVINTTHTVIWVRLFLWR